MSDARRRRDGFPVVLTADRVLMADYPTLLDGMLAASLTTSVPEPFVTRFLAPPVPVEGVRARKAPLGVRLVEAALVGGGLAREDVAVVPPRRLRRAVGPATRAVLVSSGDPLGLGMNTSTMEGVGGGRAFTALWFARMMRGLRRLRRRHAFRTLVGGPGAWQLAQDPAARRRLGVDVVYTGYAGGELAPLVRAVVAGAEVDEVHASRAVLAGRPPELLGAAGMGVVEVSRGCGLGCRFCTMAGHAMAHVPLEAVREAVRRNVSGGVGSVCLISEDFLRYGSQGEDLDPEALVELARAVRAVEGARLIQLDHVNVSSAARIPEADLRALREELTRGVRHEYVWVNLGVETADGELLARDCPGKLRPFAPRDWEDVCGEAVARLHAAGFAPMVSLLFGMRGESARSLARTLEFVERLQGERVTVFPLFHAPVRPGERGFTVRDMTPLHWQIFRRAYERNFRVMPRMYWDNHAAAGAGLARRLLVQLGGVCRKAEWRARFALMARRAGRVRMPEACRPREASGSRRTGAAGP